jgi:hypothetical protein
MVGCVAPVPEIDEDAGTPPVERRQRLVHGALLVLLLVTVGAGVTSMRDWELRPGSGHQLQHDFDEFHLEDRFHRVSEDAGAAEAGAGGGEVRLVRVYRTSAGPQDAVAQVRSALRSAGVSSTVWTGPAGLQLVSTSDLQDRGRQVTAGVTVDRSVPGEPTTIKVVLTDWV